MPFFMLPDSPLSEPVLARLRAIAGDGVVTHASGRPWLLGDVREARSGAPSHGRTVTVDESGTVTDLAPGASVRGCVHVASSVAGTAGLRGTLSTSRHVYWSVVDGTAVASDSQAALVDLGGARLDHDRLALALCSNLPASALRLRPFWHGLRGVGPGETLVLAADGVQVLPSPAVAELGDVDPTEAAALVGDELGATVRARSGRHWRIGCDLSGGVDSTALAYLLDSTGADVTYVHASTDDAANEDSRWARRAAGELRGPLVELDSFSSTGVAFAAEVSGARHVDGPPAWGAHAVHLSRLFARLRERGVTLHVTGLGGDELFSALPAAALGLWARDRRAGARAIGRLRAMQRWPLVPTVRSVLSRRGYGDELRARAAGARAGQDDGPAQAFSWSPGFGPSRFATPSANEILRAEAGRVAADAVPHFADRARHQVLEAVVFQGEVTRQVNAAFGSTTSWQSPFLDEALVRTVLGLPPDLVARGGDNKPLLAAATRGVVPPWLFERHDKGEYSHDLYREFRDRREQVTSMLDESHLVAAGLVDADLVRSAVGSPVPRTDQLFELEHLVGLERWVRSVA